VSDGPYKLPEGWRWVRLGEVVTRQSDVIKPYDEPDKLYHYIGLEHLEAGQWTEPGENWVSGAEIRSSCIRFRPGYVLYAKLRPYLNKVVVCSREGIASTEFVPMVPAKEVWPDYLGAYLRSPFFVEYASHNTTGSRMPRVRMDALREALIPLPSLDEQRRIVAKVEVLMARVREARRLRTEAQKDAERLMQAALAEVFPRPGSALPHGWRWVRLGEVCLPTERRDPTKNPSTYFVYVDISAIDNTVAKIVSPKEILGQHAPSRARKVIHSGDVIFATTRPYLKNIALVPPDLDGQICSTGFCVIRANREFAEPEFLFHLCRSDFVTDQLTASKMRGASYPAVTDNDVYNTLIPLPPLEEQRRIVAYLDQVQRQVTALKRAQTETEGELKRLEQAILDKAFRGEL
jgi:type I restriction enzyme S subunit